MNSFIYPGAAENGVTPDAVYNGVYGAHYTAYTTADGTVLPRLCLPDTYDSASYALRVSCPVTVIRAEQAEIVGTARTEGLIRSFSSPVTLVNVPAGHNTLLSGPGMAETLRTLLPR